MKVLLISFSELPTLQRHLYVLSEGLTKLGVETSTLGSSALKIDVDLQRNNNLIETPSSPKPSLQSLLAMNRELNKIVQMAIEIDPDVIHFINKHTWNYFLIRMLKKQLPETKFIHTFHDPVGHEGDSVQKGVVLYHKLVERLLDAIVVHSDIAKDQTLKLLKPMCPVFQVPLGEKPWKPFNSVPFGTKEVLIFGRLNPYKGLKYYPEILDELYGLDPGIHVTIAGKASDGIESSLLAEIGSKPNCTLANRFVEDSDVDGYFDCADIVLVPYTSITQSGVILDAYSRSRPVVSFDIPGMEQYVPDSENRVRAFDCAAFSRRVVELLSDGASCDRAALNAWNFGKNRFSPSKMAEATKKVYSEIADF